MSDNNEDLEKKIYLTDDAGAKQEVSLGDLLGIDMDEVAEKRASAFPKVTAVWEIESFAPGVINEGTDKAKAGIIGRFKCLEVITLTDNEYTGTADELVNKVHQETFFITNLEGLGYLKAFLKDCGAPYNKNLAVMLQQAAGTRFQAPISKRKNPNDTDQVFTNLNRSKMKPLAAAEGSSVAAAVG